MGGVNPDVTAALYPPERLDRVQEATAARGLGAVFLTPGPDLRYVTGYDAIQLERLTCLVVPAEAEPFLVVPRLELPAAQASPAGALGVELVPWAETEDPFALVASRVSPDVARVGVADRMWAVMALRFRDALPGVAQVPAGQVLRALRARKSEAEVEGILDDQQQLRRALRYRGPRQGR